MRIKIILRPEDPICTIPINYQYPLSAAIYKILNSASPQFAEFLHSKGYISASGKPMKLFTFSRIYSPHVRQIKSTLQIRNKSLCTLYISSPMLEDFIQNFVIGLFQMQRIEIKGPTSSGNFTITHVETLPQPNFDEESRFTCLSPIVASAKHEYNGKNAIYYIRPDDPQLSEAVRKNLIQKYNLVHTQPLKNDQIIFKIDKGYVQRKGGFDKITKLITVKEGDVKQQTKIKSFLTPFSLSGSIELMEVAYQCGVGEKNSLGFGMIEIVR